MDVFIAAVDKLKNLIRISDFLGLKVIKELGKIYRLRAETSGGTFLKR
jgi:hypothetical protein